MRGHDRDDHYGTAGACMGLECDCRTFRDEEP
jgi:hypothetical protein